MVYLVRDDYKHGHERDHEIAAVIREAAAEGESLRIIGQGTWLEAGHPVRATRTLSLAEHTGIVDYTPGDLTITVRAGTTLEEIDTTLWGQQQWLPLDPLGGGGGSIGATLATCSYGPMAELFGTPRDQTLGLTIVTGAGDILHPGGRVVKNVAGFDLTRLMIGAWGTLGVITQVTLRVRVRSSTNDAFEHMRRAMPSSYGYREPMVTHAGLTMALQRTFDPHGVLNPGILGETP